MPRKITGVFSRADCRVLDLRVVICFGLMPTRKAITIRVMDALGWVSSTVVEVLSLLVLAR